MEVSSVVSAHIEPSGLARVRVAHTVQIICIIPLYTVAQFQGSPDLRRDETPWMKLLNAVVLPSLGALALIARASLDGAFRRTTVSFMIAELLDPQG